MLETLNLIEMLSMREHDLIGLRLQKRKNFNVHYNINHKMINLTIVDSKVTVNY